ncbi:MAG: GNAT family N-acetyltransferase [Bdellovibrio sp.]
MRFDEFITSKEQIWQPQGSMLDANYSRVLGTDKLAVHWVKLPPNQRSSTPHAESLEEEFVYVVAGHPHVWINGYIYQLEPKMAVGFPAGSGISHTFINNTQDDVEMIVLGERSKKENKYVYPINPELFEEHKNAWWTDWPKQEMGPHQAQPGDLNHQKDWRELAFIRSLHELERKKGFSYPGDNETFSQGVRLTDHLGMKAVGVWHEVMKSGKRSSWPHAHKLEEELAVVINGKARVWLNGFVHDLCPGDCVYFKPGTNIAHVLMNESDADLEFLGIGQADNAGPEERIVYPFYDNRNQNCKDRGWLWENPPFAILGDNLGLPRSKSERIEMLSGAEQFLTLLRPLLLQKEAEYSLLLGLAGLRQRLKDKPDDDHYIAVYENNELVGGCVVTGKNLVVSQISGPLLVPLAKFLFDHQCKFPGVVGAPATCEIFAMIWHRLSGQDFKLGMAQKIYQLDEVILPANMPGQLLKAQESHASLVGQWVYEFSCESLPHEPTTIEKTREFAIQKIKNGEVYLWQDESGKIVSMNSVGRPTDNGISVSAVYTPSPLRGKGFASAVVAKTSEQMLKDGRKFCVLYTDLSNPTSNKIYQNVGYKEVASSKHFVFGSAFKNMSL